ncbi:MAG: hypothetical protein AAF667_14090 [Pseudomonadota bacterium]
MRRFMLIPLSLFVLLAAASVASAACYADYKAKRGNPLQLHYGVIEVPENACNAGAAANVVKRRIGRDGWELLNIVSVFRDGGGLERRKASAGAYYLKY